MKKQQRIHIGDKVTWDEAPNQFRNTTPGTVLAIKKNIATISDIRNGKTRTMPIKKLKLYKRGS